MNRQLMLTEWGKGEWNWEWVSEPHSFFFLPTALGDLDQQSYKLTQPDVSFSIIQRGY